MKETQEVELKLDLEPPMADRLEAAKLFAGKPKIAALRAIYFDTPDCHLAGAGFSLRIRTVGRRRVQTVKADSGSAAGLFSRPEWERVVSDDIPVLDEATPIRSLLGRKAGDIVPAFEVHVERRTWDVTENDSRVEVALDRGKVVVGERQTSICEVELELKHGSPAALFLLARKIDAVAKVRLGVLSKSERGYRLLGPAPGAARAERVSLDADMTAAAMFQHVARSTLRHFRLNETLLLQHRDMAALHEARVALRRLRSAFSIHRSMVEDGDFDRLRGELGWLASELGEARNLDVLLERNQAGPLHAGLVQARGQAYATAEAAIASDRARAVMIDLAEWIALGAWLTQPGGREVRNRPAADFAAKALNRFLRKVKRHGGGLTELDDEARHEVRKATKKLRYAAEFFAALFDRKKQRRRYRRFVSALGDLQTQLGDLNDLATAPVVLERHELTKEPRADPRTAAKKKRKLITAAADAYDNLVQAKRFWRSR